MSHLLTLKHIFGLKGDVKNNIHYFDESHVIYPAGQNIIVYNVESKAQVKVQSMGDVKEKENTGHTEINAMALSPNRKFLAVAERGERPILTIFDVSSIGSDGGVWKKRRPNMPVDTTFSEFVWLAFSADSKLLLTLGGAPEWSLMLWQWEKGRVLNSIRVSNAQGSPVYSCSFNPNDSSFVCVTGNGIMKFFRLDQQGGEFKPIQSSIGKRDPQNYISHTWLDDKLLVACDNGDILIYGDSGEFRGPIGATCETGIEAIMGYNKGFICGCGDGILQIFEKDEKEGFKKKPPFSIKHNPGRVTNLQFSPSEDNLVCTTDNNQSYILPLTSSDILDLKIEVLAQPFHHGIITGMDVCIRKPLLVTCGIDKSVRVWNYSENNLELMKYFAEEPYSIAIHPSGLTIAVGFNDKLRLMNLLIEDIRAFKEFPIKGCREIQFSNGGQYFAAVNGTTISVYSTYSCDVVVTCRGHSSKVRSLFWTSTDSLISCGMDGSIFEWELKDGTQLSEFTMKGCSFSSVVSDGKFYAIGSDRMLKEIAENNVTAQIDTGSTITQLAITHPNNVKIVIGGNESGMLKLFKFPLNSSNVQDIYVHSSAVSRVRFSYDDSSFFSASEDGSLAVFDVSKDKRKEKETVLPWAEEILVTKSDLEEKLTCINDLKNKVEELHLHNEYQSKLREDKLRDLTEVFQKEIMDVKQNYEALIVEKSDLEKQYSKRLAGLAQKQDDKLNQLEQFQEQKLDAERSRYNELQRKLDVGLEKWQDMLVQRRSLYAENIAKIKKEYAEKLSSEVAQCQALNQFKNSIEEQFGDLKVSLEQDADLEIDELKEMYDKKIWSEKETEQKYSAENGILKLRYNGLKEEIKRQKEDIKVRFDKEKSLYEQIHILEKDVEGFKKEISERDMTIEDKKQRIYDLRKKNQELEKFKFVLDYKIKELRRQIEPREIEIKEMQSQISEMESELTEYRSGNEAQKLKVHELQLKVTGMSNECDLQKAKNSVLEVEMLALQNDLHDVVQDYESARDIKTVTSGMKKLYRKHITKDMQAEADTDIHEEYQRQRYYLEKSVDTLKQKMSKDAKVHKKENIRIVQENVALIREINELRKEIKYIKDTQLKEKNSPKKKLSSTSKLPLLLEEINKQNDQINFLEQQLTLIQRTELASAPNSHTNSQASLSMSGTAHSFSQSMLPPI